MLKKIIGYSIIFSVLFLFTACMGNGGPDVANQQKSNKFRIDELVLLPHPGKFIKQGKIELSMEQKQKLQKVKKEIVPIFQTKMREAFKLEKKVQRFVAKGVSKENLKVSIDKIAKLKREALDVRLDALYAIKDIMTKEQWELSNKLTYK